MGAGASLLPSSAMDKDYFKKLAPDHFSVSLFNALKDSQGIIPPARLLQFTSQATDCFLTHDWGKDELGRDNHARVGKLNALLKAKGFRTWFDEDRMRGDIQQQMADGIEHTACVIVFITERYMDKVAGKGEKGNLDNCLFEFSHLSTSKDRNKIFPVVMEPRCRDTAAWFGKVKFVLGNQLYTDYSTDGNEETIADDLANKMRQVLTDGLIVNERLGLMSVDGKGAEGASPAPVAPAVPAEASRTAELDKVEGPVEPPQPVAATAPTAAAPAAPTAASTAPTIASASSPAIPTDPVTEVAPTNYLFTSNESLKAAVAMWFAPGGEDDALKKYGHISTWNTSQITSMFELFKDRKHFNEDITRWDVSRVTNFFGMFTRAIKFNQPIGVWNTNSATNMGNMFFSANIFNQPIGSWNISKVTNLEYTFGHASKFNQPIGAWDVSNAISMFGLFQNASSFNQPIGTWNVSKVTKMTYMFLSAKAFNQPIGAWDVSSAKNLDGMFNAAICFNQPIGAWNVSKATSLNGMFTKAAAFNQPIGDWDVSHVVDMEDMFSNATSFNQPIGGWNISKGCKVNKMFDGSGYGHAHPQSKN